MSTEWTNYYCIKAYFLYFLITKINYTTINNKVQKRALPSNQLWESMLWDITVENALCLNLFNTDLKVTKHSWPGSRKNPYRIITNSKFKILKSPVQLTLAFQCPFNLKISNSTSIKLDFMCIFSLDFKHNTICNVVP